MKRPLGLIGLTYLFTLAAVYYLYSFALIVCLLVSAAAAPIIAVIYRFIRRRGTAFASVIAAGLSVIAAVTSIFLYQNNKEMPILLNYEGNEITVEGYVCDELHFNKSYVSFVIQAEKINGESSSAKINYTMRNEYDLYPFDKLKVTLTPKQSGYDYQKSRGIFLYAFEQDNANLTVTGEKHHSIRSFAFSVRRQMKQVLERSLDENAAALSEAVLLGDKQALPAGLRQAFNDTGISYLIVVSGMHLAVVTMLLRRLLKRIKANHWISFVLIALLTLGFMAVTGFSSSVTRAGIMLLIVYFGKAVFRDADGINSLGAAALVLTVFNPYAVGNVGMLLSFAATFGILLWAEPINAFCLKALRFDKKPLIKRKNTFRTKVVSLIKKTVRIFIAFFCTSLAATLWVMPLEILFFGKVTPLTVLFSLIAYPITCAVLFLAMFLVLLSALLPFVPFWGKVFAPPLNFSANILSALVTGFSKLPLASVSANDTYCYVWIGVSAALVVCGYLFHARKTYILISAIISVLTFTVGGSVTYLFADTSAKLEIFRGGSGFTAVIRRENNTSLLICNDTKTIRNRFGNTLLDYVILTGKSRGNRSAYAELSENSEIINTFVYEKNPEKALISDDSSHFFGDRSEFTVKLNREISVRTVSLRGKVYQYFYSDSVSVLVLPDKARVGDLSEEFLSADYALIAGEVKDSEKLKCGRYLAVNETALKSIEKAELINDGESRVIRMSVD